MREVEVRITILSREGSEIPVVEMEKLKRRSQRDRGMKRGVPFRPKQVIF